jgi:hypothetical protein
MLCFGRRKMFFVSLKNIFNEIIFQKKNNFAENIFHHLAHIKKLLTAKNHC